MDPDQPMHNDVVIWLKLAVEHPYFDSVGFADLFRIHPSAENSAADIFMRPVGDGLWVYGRRPPPHHLPTGSSEPAALNQILPPSALSFGLEFLDPEFLNYTEFGSESDGDGRLQTRMYLSTVLPQPAGELQEVRLGPVGGTMEAIEAPQAQPDEPRFLIERSVPTRADGFRAKFCFADGQTYPPGPGDALMFEAPDALFFQPYPAVFEWRFDPEGAQPGGVPIFTLRFEARSTYWRYFLTGLPEAASGSLAVGDITAGELRVKFETQPEPVILPGGQPAVVIISDQPIPMRQHPNWKVMLNFGTDQDPLRLPFPGTGISLLERAGGRVCCSDMFVQI